VASGRRVPVIYDAHTTLASELPAYNLGLPSGIKRRIGRLLDRLVPTIADHTIAVTESIRDYLVDISAVEPDRADVVSNGVEIEHFDVTDRDRPLAVPPTETVTYAGNLAPYQRIDLLLEAFGKVRGQRSSSRLLIATTDPFDPFERQAQALGIRESVDVVSTGFEDLPALLAQTDVAVNPRVVCEGIPQKNLNYMASGVPLVSFQSSANPYVHEETGIAVKDGDTDAFAAALLRLLSEPKTRQRMGQAARTRVGQMSWLNQASKIESIYRAVLERRRGSGA
jgi:glycosyltransferase involved in cell wall biosynthesis